MKITCTKKEFAEIFRGCGAVGTQYTGCKNCAFHGICQNTTLEDAVQITVDDEEYEE